VPEDAIDEGDAWRVGRYLIVTVLRIDDQVADCQVDHAETPAAMLRHVAHLVAETRGLLHVWDLDADDHRAAGTVRECSTGTSCSSRKPHLAAGSP
jgi:hypothetical protein